MLQPHAGASAAAAGATPYAAAPTPSVLPEVTVKSKPHAHNSPPVFTSPNAPWVSATAPTSLIARSRPQSGSSSGSGSAVRFGSIGFAFPVAGAVQHAHADAHADADADGFGVTDRFGVAH